MGPGQDPYGAMGLGPELNHSFTMISYVRTIILKNEGATRHLSLLFPLGVCWLHIRAKPHPSHWGGCLFPVHPACFLLCLFASAICARACLGEKTRGKTDGVSSFAALLDHFKWNQCHPMSREAGRNAGP